MATKTVLPGNEARGIAAKSGRGVARPRAWLDPSMSTEVPKADNPDVECPTCGKDGFRSTGGMKAHHKLVHDESIAGTEVGCTWCGETKRQRAGRESGRHFCGPKCQGKWLEENNNGENNPTWKPSVTVQCSWCGGLKEVYPYKARQQKYFFHDGCQAEWNAETRSGENSPHWRGGPFLYGKGFSASKRERVRERQNRRCAGCGVDETGLPVKLDVHHIQKARSFDNDELCNAESNLVALCRSCHMKWERLSPLRPQTPYLD